MRCRLRVPLWLLLIVLAVAPILILAVGMDLGARWLGCWLWRRLAGEEVEGNLPST
jgi:hypothetical protein